MQRKICLYVKLNCKFNCTKKKLATRYYWEAYPGNVATKNKKKYLYIPTSGHFNEQCSCTRLTIIMRQLLIYLLLLHKKLSKIVIIHIFSRNEMYRRNIIALNYICFAGVENSMFKYWVMTNYICLAGVDRVVFNLFRNISETAIFSGTLLYNNKFSDWSMEA